MLAVIATLWVVVVLVGIAVAANREKIIEIDKWERALHTLERLGDEPVDEMEVTTQRQLDEPNVKVVESRPALPQQREPAHDQHGREPAAAPAATASHRSAEQAAEHPTEQPVEDDTAPERKPVPSQDAPADEVTSKPEQYRAA
ncbi:MAG: hypothetical protein ACJ73S_31490 [Mycobacteriales bacterium]